jgi:hypothetical protein
LITPYVVDVFGTTSSLALVMEPSVGVGSWSAVPENASLDLAPVTSPSQAYYWTRAWQEGEREALADLEAGRSIVFKDSRDAIRYLLTEAD